MLQKRYTIFYGWVVVGAAGFMLFGSTGTRFSFGAFMKPMTDEFGWGREDLSLVFGLTVLMAGVIRPAVGILADRYGGKRFALPGMLLAAAMLALVPLVDNLAQLYAVYIPMAFGFSLAEPPIFTKMVSSWFSRQRGLALGLTNAGSGFGSAILLPISVIMVAFLSWREAYFVLAGIVAFIVVPIGWRYLKESPREMGLLPDGESNPTGAGTVASRKLEQGLSLLEALRTATFWRLTAGIFA